MIKFYFKEIAEPKGAVIYAKNFTLGDPTIDTLELWGAEYQVRLILFLNLID